jgi:hypothetical protein
MVANRLMRAAAGLDCRECEGDGLDGLVGGVAEQTDVDLRLLNWVEHPMVPHGGVAVVGQSGPDAGRAPRIHGYLQYPLSRAGAGRPGTSSPETSSRGTGLLVMVTTVPLTSRRMRTSAIHSRTVVRP